jgi:hypothetical protein
MFAFALCRAAAVCVATLLLFVSAAEMSFGQGSPASEVTYFYRSPSATKAADIVKGFNTSALANNPGALPGLVGFLSVVFEKYPDDIERILPADPKPQVRAVLATALNYAGQKNRARAVASAPGAVLPPGFDPAKLPDARFDAVAAISPMHYDMLWGASVASGDPKYCRKILAAYAAFANHGDNADILFKIVSARMTRGDMRAILRPIIQSQGERRAAELVGMSTALWSLVSNAKQHSFVRVEVHKYYSQNPFVPAAQTLIKLQGAWGDQSGQGGTAK